MKVEKSTFIVMVDEGSGLTLVRAAPDGSAEAARQAAVEMIDGVQMKKITSDGGSEFKGVFQEEVLQREIELNKSAPGDAAGQGRVENAIKGRKSIAAKLATAKDEDLVEQGLAKEVDGKTEVDWEAIVEVAAEVVNNRVPTGQAGTPLQVYDAKRPPARQLESALGIDEPDVRPPEQKEQERVELEQKSAELKNQERSGQQERFNARRRKKQRSFKVGDLVMRGSHEKKTKMGGIGRRNEGPYKVVAVNGRTYSLGIEGLDGFVAYEKATHRQLAPFEKQADRQEIPEFVAKILNRNTVLHSDMPERVKDQVSYYPSGVWHRAGRFRLRRLRRRIRQAREQREQEEQEQGEHEVQENNNAEQEPVAFRDVPQERRAEVRRRQNEERQRRRQARLG
jgi:hypothetical protein